MMVIEERFTPTGVAYQRFSNLRRGTATVLVRAGYRSWKQIAQASDADLLALKGVGPSVLADIRREQWLESF